MTLINKLNTESIKVCEGNRVITIVPAEEREYNCPLLGAAVGSKLTVESFLEMMHEDKESEAW
jgi:hypothetical protein